MDFSPGCVCMLPKGSDYTVDTIEPGECIAINFNLLDDPPLDPFSECFRAAPKLETLFRKLDNQRFDIELPVIASPSLPLVARVLLSLVLPDASARLTTRAS